MKLTSMRLSQREQEAKAEPASVVADKPRYPWGLGLHLDDETLEKLGISELPKVGKTLMISARVDVTGAMEQEMEGAGKHRTAQLQITDMAIGPDEGEGGDAAEKLYGGK